MFKKFSSNKISISAVLLLCLVNPCRAMEQESGFLKDLRQLFRQPQEVAANGFVQGHAFLHEAVEIGDIGVLNFLIQEQHAKTEIVNSSGDYPLHIAVKKRSYPVVQCLLAQGADPNVRDGDGNMPLHLAVTGDNISPEIVRSLLRYGSNANIANTKRERPLHIAVRDGLTEVVRLLLCYEANVDLQEPIAKKQFVLYTNVDARDADGNTPLHLAVSGEKYSKGIICLLLDHFPGINITNTKGDTPLHIAVRKRLLDATLFLLCGRGIGANPNVQDADGNTPLHLAVIVNSSDMVELLLVCIDPFLKSGKINPDITNKEKEAPLHIAVRKGLLDIIQQLLVFGADVNVQDAGGNTPLHLAEAGGDGSPEIVELLLAHKADTEITNNEGLKSVHIAVIHRQEQLIKQLLAHGVDVNTQDAGGNTSLQLAVAGGNGSTEIIEFLLAHKADTNIVNLAGDRPLHMAVVHRQEQLVKQLLAHGARVNVPNIAGEIPMDLALAGDNVSLEIVNLLLNHSGAPQLTGLEKTLHEAIKNKQ